VTFLYLLLKEKLPAGEVEVIVNEAEINKGTTVLFSNKGLQLYAEELADRLRLEDHK